MIIIYLKRGKLERFEFSRGAKKIGGVSLRFWIWGQDFPAVASGRDGCQMGVKPFAWA